MLELHKGITADIKVIPRGFSKSVLIDKEAFKAIEEAQLLLPQDIKLVITRAYQPESTLIKFARIIGSKVFALIYPKRKPEIPEIFGHNGHATDGKHVDISIEYKGQILKLLPISVFTKPDTAKNISRQYSEIISQVWHVLQQCGFAIHNNKIEALQIHCDFITKPQ
jgi:hypothetical protein